MLNSVIIMGRLCADPEFRQTTSGIPVCRFRVAVNRPYRKDAQNQEADFINCTAWRATAEFVARYFSKGAMIAAEGALRNNDYTDNNGVKHYSMSVLVDQVHFCEKKQDNQNGGYQQQNGGYYGGYNNAPQQYQQPQAGAYQQPQQYQQPQGGGYQQPPQQYQQQPAQGGLSIDNLGDFEEILSDGEVPF